MALLIESRKSWGAAPPDDRTFWNTSELFGFALHHFGGPKAARTHEGCRANARSVQADHMGPGGLGVPDGGDDIAYNLGVCPHLKVLDFRGWDVQTGANGDAVSNRHWFAVVYMADLRTDPFPEAAQDLIARVFAEGFKRGINRVVRTHQSFSGSGCPGPPAIQWVNSGGWKKDLPSVKQVQFELWDEGKKLLTSRRVPLAERAARLAAFDDFSRAKRLQVFADEGAIGNVTTVERVFS